MRRQTMVRCLIVVVTIGSVAVITVLYILCEIVEVLHATRITSSW